ncbi:MAG: site-2 protease family protein, partial [Myxococcales bacterium]|nr:site-2 protease family protein [Myxococcales bacterium]
MTQVLAFILLIGPLIFIHELGHLLAAKLVNVKVLRFSLGFGRPLARIRIGETEYCIAPIPLGGYVRLLGQGPDEDVSPQEEDRALRSRPLWARFFVLGAGPVFNLALPLILYFAFFLSHTVVGPPVIGTVLDDSAAAAAELRAGDRVVEIEGEDVHSWHDMQTHVRAAPERELRLQIERDGVRFDRFVTPRRTTAKDVLGESIPRGLLGVYPWVYAPQIGIVDPASPAFEEGLRTGDIITAIDGQPTPDLTAFYTVADGLAPAETVTYSVERAGQVLDVSGPHPLPARAAGIALNSAARDAGMQTGDVVLSVDGNPVWAFSQLPPLVSEAGGEPVALSVWRAGTVLDLSLTPRRTDLPTADGG